MEKPECEKALKDLIYLFSQDSHTLPKIKELYNEINREKIDLYKLLARESNYHEGFVNFINSISNVDIKEEWWQELEEELGHLQSEIAFRKREDVKDCVNAFYIQKIKEQNKPSAMELQASGEGSVSDIVSEPTATVAKATPDAIKQARNCVKSQTMPSMMWQKVVLDLIEEHPEVSEFLIKYLGS